jgi:DNA-binding NarL/FixJ family response regulator
MKKRKSETGQTRVLIVDDHPMTRAGLVFVIGHEPDLMVCGEAENAAQGLQAAETTKPDLVLIDITLPGKSGLELIKDLKAINPSLLMLVLSMHEESLYAERVLRAGARGYITKHEGGAKLIHAVRQVLSGKISVSEKVSAQILEVFSGGPNKSKRSPIDQLSDREFEVFKLIGEGLSAHQIADRLNLSAKTVDAHRANIRSKMKIAGHAELISFAARWLAGQSVKDA